MDIEEHFGVMIEQIAPVANGHLGAFGVTIQPVTHVSHEH